MLQNEVSRSVTDGYSPSHRPEWVVWLDLVTESDDLTDTTDHSEANGYTQLCNIYTDFTITTSLYIYYLLYMYYKVKGIAESFLRGVHSLTIVSLHMRGV